jgi:hypothetical protein
MRLVIVVLIPRQKWSNHTIKKLPDKYPEAFWVCITTRLKYSTTLLLFVLVVLVLFFRPGTACTVSGINGYPPGDLPGVPAASG